VSGELRASLVHARVKGRDGGAVSRGAGAQQSARRLAGRARRAVGFPFRGADEPVAHWSMRAARLAALQRADPDPLGDIRDSGDSAIDVVLPVGPRDTEIVDLALDGVGTNLRGPIGHIYCIAPQPLCRALTRRYPHVSVVDENDVCRPAVRRGLEATYGDRAGWMMQQLVTLSTPEISSAAAAVVIDADTVLVRPRRFRAGNKTLVLAAEEFHVSYYRLLSAVWQQPVALPRFSCIAHQMCFVRDDLLSLRGAIEGLWGVSWVDALLACCEPESRALSEYELYGQWRLHRAAAATVVSPMRNAARRRAPGDTVRSLSEAAPRGTYSISCHWYL
jgi:hypothetical protein